ncbi:hypothetical protein CEXT_237681 [Caerostris extrusa]|uniref:Uncharacterized protein n=1 Tax=Caerostris extrusa TaxID=172846 RepID=A0AAV4RKW9_CAEEX|nr:hypothetical protein CEXT_237681 [Caerostris extrusa]
MRTGQSTTPRGDNFTQSVSLEKWLVDPGVPLRRETDGLRTEACHLPRSPSIVQNAHWSEHYSEGDNFSQSVSLEKWLVVVKTETDWWILAALPPLVSGQRDISTRKYIIRFRIESWDFCSFTVKDVDLQPANQFPRDANVFNNMECEIGQCG